MENVSVCIQRAPNGSAKEIGEEFDEIAVVKFWKKNNSKHRNFFNPIILQLFRVVMTNMTTIVLAHPLASEQTHMTCRGIF